MASLHQPSELHPIRTSTDSVGRGSRTRRYAVPAALVAAGLAVTVLAGPATAAPTPSPTGSAAPTLASVTAKLTELSRQNEALAEKFNAATIDLTAKQKSAATAKAAATKAQADFKAALKRYGSTIVDQYQNGQLSKAGALLTSSSTQDYLDTVTDLATVSRHNSAVVDQLSATKQKATTAQAASAKAVTAATAVRDSLAAQKKELDTRTASYKALLKSLTPVQQVAYTNRDTAPAGSAPTAAAAAAGTGATGGTGGTVAVHAGSAAAQTAIDFALAQQGKPYQYAASGPNAYDCSGLTAAAYAAAGISLPHQSSAQYGYGTHVSLSEMQPGDLVFFYSPISHVAIYLGNGMIVHAPTSGDVVKVSPMFSGAVGATRLT